jgi:hypothetical protein
MKLERNDYSWRRLALESAARMAEHDALPQEFRELSNERGIVYAREEYIKRQTSDFFGFS